MLCNYFNIVQIHEISCLYCSFLNNNNHKTLFIEDTGNGCWKRVTRKYKSVFIVQFWLQPRHYRDSNFLCTVNSGNKSGEDLPLRGWPVLHYNQRIARKYKSVFIVQFWLQPRHYRDSNFLCTVNSGNKSGEDLPLRGWPVLHYNQRIARKYKSVFIVQFWLQPRHYRDSNFLCTVNSGNKSGEDLPLRGWPVLHYNQRIDFRVSRLKLYVQRITRYSCVKFSLQWAVCSTNYIRWSSDI